MPEDEQPDYEISLETFAMMDPNTYRRLLPDLKRKRTINFDLNRKLIAQEDELKSLRTKVMHLENDEKHADSFFFLENAEFVKFFVDENNDMILTLSGILAGRSGGKFNDDQRAELQITFKFLAYNDMTLKMNDYVQRNPQRWESLFRGINSG